jgi:hypothetical protein
VTTSCLEYEIRLRLCNVLLGVHEYCMQKSNPRYLVPSSYVYVNKFFWGMVSRLA